MSEQPKTPDTLAIRQHTVTVREEAERLQIVSDETYAGAGALLKKLKGLEKDVHAMLDEPIAKIFQAHKAMKAVQNERVGEIEACAIFVEGKRRDWRTAQERARQAEQARLNAEVQEAEETRQVEQAAQLEREGKAEQADAVLAQPVKAPIVIVPKSIPKTEGVSVREHWTFEVADETLVPREYLIVNQTALGSIARSMKSLAKVPGVRFYAVEKESVSA